MARKIFFSFHYERDAWRAGQVRNSNVVSSDDRYGFIDAVDWESIKRQGTMPFAAGLLTNLNTRRDGSTDRSRDRKS